MVVQPITPASNRPSSTAQTMMASAVAAGHAPQHSFTLTPLGPHIPSGYSTVTGANIGGGYFPPSSAAGTAARFGNTTHQHHNFDGSFAGAWSAPFGGTGLARPAYNNMPQFISGQNQVN